MLSAKRIYEEFKSTNLLLTRRTLWALLILSLWMILKYFFYFKIAEWNEPIDINFSLIFIIASLVSATDVFAKLRGPVSGTHYLLTPANTEEKFISAWLYSTVYTFLVVFVLTSLLHLVCMLIGNALTGVNLPLEMMSLQHLARSFWVVMFIHSLFFLGSVVFRKNPVVKTMATIILTVLVISFVTSWILRGVIVWKNNFSFHFDSQTDWESILGGRNPEEWAVTLKTILQILYYSLPFALWTASYFTLKHKQI